MQTTATQLLTHVTILSSNTGEFYDSPKQAVEDLCKFGHLSIDNLTKNPLFALQEAMKAGLIDVRFNAQDLPKEDRPELKMQTRTEPPQVKQLKIEAPEIIKPAPVKQVVKETAPTDKATQFLALINEMVTPQVAPIDLQQVREIVREELQNQEPKRIEVKTERGTTEIKGLIHKDFETCLKIVGAGKNLWLYGPAGSGKSHTAIQISEALNLPFYFIPTSAQSTKIDFLGYNSATGEYIKTPFYDAYKNGGIFLADEIDAANPNTLVTLNAALSNKKMFFAGELVEMHPDFRLIAGANTKGSGATSQFSGRNPIDGATKDRFIFVYFGYDEELELKLSPVKDFTKKVQELRAKAVKLGSTAIISPRASIDGGDLINLGFTVAQALDMVIFNKLDEATIKLLK